MVLINDHQAPNHYQNGMTKNSDRLVSENNLNVLTMDYKTFNYTLDMGQPPAGFSEPVKALWWERKGYWGKAHEIVQELTSKEAAWVHAYLHRKEGDQMNAAYWYDRAGKKDSSKNYDEEFREILNTLLPGN